MIFLLNCAIKVSLILVVTLIAVRLLRRQSAALRHCALAAGIFSAAITPGLSLLIPGWTWNVVEAPAPLPPVYSAAAESASSISRSFTPMPLPRPSANDAPKPRQAASISPAPAVSPQRKWFSYSLSAVDTLALLWVTGFGISFSILVVGYAHLFWIARESRPLNSEVWTRVGDQVRREYALRHPPRLLQNDSLSVLFTWGWRRPRVLVPESAPSWPVERIRAVLCHELAHIRRGDWVVQMAAELVRTVYWFNPLLWVACRYLRRESEQACDDAALNSGIAGSDYAAHVLDVLKSLHSSRRAWSCALSMAEPSTLEQRFVAMLNPSANRQTMTRHSIVAVVAAFLLATVTLSSLSGAAAAAEPALSLFAGRGAPVPPLSLQTPPPLTERMGIVQGVVRRSGTGEPVAGVEISLDGGPADQKLVDSLVRGVANRGVIFKPKRIGTVDEVLQDVLDAAGEIGVGPGFPLFQEALDNFTNAAAARFTAISDKDGRFTIRNVAAGDYFVQPAREGFFDPALGLGGPRGPRLGISVIGRHDDGDHRGSGVRRRDERTRCRSEWTARPGCDRRCVGNDVPERVSRPSCHYDENNGRRGRVSPVLARSRRVLPSSRGPASSRHRARPSQCDRTIAVQWRNAHLLSWDDRCWRSDAAHRQSRGQTLRTRYSSTSCSSRSRERHFHHHHTGGRNRATSGGPVRKPRFAAPNVDARVARFR